MINTLSLGYKEPLYILPFDHRASFEKGMFNTENDLSDLQKKEIVDEKKMIYEAFKKAILEKVPKEYAAILVDEQYGDEILQDAIKNGFNVCLTTEKSGQEEFDFEYNENFREHIEKYNPKFVKALVRYNPQGEREVNSIQEEKLKTLNDYCRDKGFWFLLEILIPPTKEQLEKVSGNLLVYEETIKPDLTIAAIAMLRNAGIKPDVFKLEGMNTRKDYEKVVLEIKKDGGENVGMVVLGRGERQEMVEKWIIEAAGVRGITGFAIGRTIFWQALVDLREERLTREEVVDIISKNYQYFYQLFIDNKNL